MYRSLSHFSVLWGLILRGRNYVAVVAAVPGLELSECPHYCCMSVDYPSPLPLPSVVNKHSPVAPEYSKIGRISRRVWKMA